MAYNKELFQKMAADGYALQGAPPAVEPQQESAYQRRLRELTGRQEQANGMPAQQTQNQADGLIDTLYHSAAGAYGQTIENLADTALYSGKPSGVSKEEWDSREAKLAPGWEWMQDIPGAGFLKSAGDAVLNLTRGALQYGEEKNKEHYRNYEPYSAQSIIQGSARVVPSLINLGLMSKTGLFRPNPGQEALINASGNVIANAATALPVVGKYAPTIGAAAAEMAKSATTGAVESTPESIMEGRDAEQGYIDEAKQNGTYVPGQTEEEAKRVGQIVLGQNIPLNALTDTVRDAAIRYIANGKGTRSSKLARMLPILTAFGGGVEMAQGIIPKEAAGQQWNWTDPEIGEAGIIGALTGFVPGAVNLGLDRAANRQAERQLENNIRNMGQGEEQPIADKVPTVEELTGTAENGDPAADNNVPPPPGAAGALNEEAAAQYNAPSFEQTRGNQWVLNNDTVHVDNLQDVTKAGIGDISAAFMGMTGQPLIITSGTDGAGALHADGTYSHGTGYKIDVSGNGLEDPEIRHRFIAYCEAQGIKVLDEYEHPSPNSTGGHLDLEFHEYNGNGAIENRAANMEAEIAAEQPPQDVFNEFAVPEDAFSDNPAAATELFPANREQQQTETPAEMATREAEQEPAPQQVYVGNPAELTAAERMEYKKEFAKIDKDTSSLAQTFTQKGPFKTPDGKQIRSINDINNLAHDRKRKVLETIWGRRDQQAQANARAAQAAQPAARQGQTRIAADRQTAPAQNATPMQNTPQAQEALRSRAAKMDNATLAEAYRAAKDEPARSVFASELENRIARTNSDLRIPGATQEATATPMPKREASKTQQRQDEGPSLVATRVAKQGHTQQETRNTNRNNAYNAEQEQRFIGQYADQYQDNLTGLQEDARQGIQRIEQAEKQVDDALKGLEEDVKAGKVTANEAAAMRKTAENTRSTLQKQKAALNNFTRKVEGELRRRNRTGNPVTDGKMTPDEYMKQQRQKPEPVKENPAPESKEKQSNTTEARTEPAEKPEPKKEAESQKAEPAKKEEPKKTAPPKNETRAEKASRLIKETFTDEEDREMANYLNQERPDNLMAAYWKLAHELEASIDEIIEPVMKEMRPFMRQGTVNEGDAEGNWTGRRLTANGKWWQDILKENKSKGDQDRAARLLAIDVATGARTDVVQGFDGSEAAQSFYEEMQGKLEALAEPLERLYSMKDDLKRIHDQLNGEPEQSNIHYQAAYHGTPHVFDTFSVEHIGSGEGMQAHGWGLYFAQNKNTAKGYQERLRKHGYLMTIDGKAIDPKTQTVIEDNAGGNVVYRAAQGDDADLKRDIKDAIKRLEEGSHWDHNLIELLQGEIERIDNNPKMPITAFLSSIPADEKYRFRTLADSARRDAKKQNRKATIADVKEALRRQLTPFLNIREREIKDAELLKALDLDKLNVKFNTGSLFEVDIPGDDVLLDEQKNFSEQPEKVKKAIQEIAYEIATQKTQDMYKRTGEERYNQTYNKDLANDIGKKYGREAQQTVESIIETPYEKTSDMFLKLQEQGLDEATIDRVDFYKKTLDDISDGPGRKTYRELVNQFGSPKAASQKLNEYGIQGITYDGLRDGRCYVVFDDKAVQIMQRYEAAARAQGPAIKRAVDSIVQEVKTAYPGAENFNVDGNHITFTMPNGVKLDINIKDEIIVKGRDEAKARQEHGLTDTSKEIVVEGYSQKLDNKSFVALSREGREGTAYHEAMHTVRDWCLTQKENQVLEKYYRPIAEKQGIDLEEAIADGYKEWKLARAKGKGTLLGKLYEKINNFIDTVKAIFTGMYDVHKLYERIESGDVWSRDAQGRFTGKPEPVFNVTERIPKKTFTDADTFIHEALTDNQKGGTLPLWTITKDEAYKIKNAIGAKVDLTGYTHVLVADDIRHSINHHGKDQLPVNEAEIKEAVRILANPARIEPGNLSNRGLPSIRFIKQKNDGTLAVVETIAMADKELRVKTIWKDPSAGDNAAKSNPVHTSAYSGSLNSSIDNTLSQSDNGSKREKQGAPLAQEHTSADTSLNQTPSIFKRVQWEKGTTNIDIGGGKFDTATDYMKEQGVNNIVFDPFNRDTEHNRNAFEKIKEKGDTATVANVLNVIKEADIRDNVILQAAKAIKPDGKAYFGIYEGNGSGKGRETTKGWQNNRKAADYVPEIAKHFKTLKKSGNMIIASNPIIQEGEKATWSMDDTGENNIRYSIRSKVTHYGNDKTPFGRTAQVISGRAEKSLLQRGLDAAKNLYFQMVDEDTHAHKVDQAAEAKIGKKLSENESFYNQVRQNGSISKGHAEALIAGSKTHMETVQERIRNKYLKAQFDTDATLQNMMDIIDPGKMNAKYKTFLADKGLPDWQAALDTYLTAHRLKEMATLAAKDGKPYKLPGKLTMADLDAAIKSAPPELEQAAKVYYQFNKNLSILLADGGLLKPELYRTLNSKYQRYCPLMRDFSDTAAADDFIGALGRGGNSVVNLSNPLREILEEGSTRNLLSPLESTIKACAIYCDRAERNKVGQAAIRMAAKYKLDDLIWRVDGKKTADPKNCIFTVMINGQKVPFQCTQELYEPIVGNPQEAADMLFSLASLPAKTLRYGATISPTFAIRNMIRDTFFAGIASKNGFIPIVDTVRGAIALRNNPELKAKFDAMGVSMQTFYGSEMTAKTKLKDLQVKEIDTLWDFAKELLKKPAEGLEWFSEFSEQSTRMGEFQRAIKNGKTLEEAARDARNLTIDFSRHGRTGKKINQIVPFFNACIQGGDLMVRLLKQDPAGTLLKLGKYIALPSIALWAINRDKDWFRDLDPDLKNTNWFIETPKGIVRIPKPQEAGVLFGSGMEALLEQASKRDPEALKNWADAFRGAIMPNYLATVISPLLENAANYSFFRNKPVVGRANEKKPGEQQFTGGTSELSKMIGGSPVAHFYNKGGYSPAKIDNLVRGYTGTMGMLLWQGMGEAANMARGIENRSPAKKVSELPFAREFLVSDYNISRPLNDFYDLVAAAETYHNTHGKKGSPSPAVMFVRRARADIAKERKAIQEITGNKHLTPERKRELIDKRQQKIKIIAQGTLKKYRDKF